MLPATATPSAGCSVDPVRLGWLLRNRPASVDRMMIAKMDIIMLLRGRVVSAERERERGGGYQLQALPEETTGFIAAGGWGWRWCVGVLVWAQGRVVVSRVGGVEVQE